MIASAASATRDHVLSHQPWTYCLPVSDGAQTLLHIACRCGKDTHVGEIVEWSPAPAVNALPVEILPCQWCGTPMEKTERRGGQKYHRACAREATKAMNRENQKAKYAARRVAVSE